MFLTVYICLEYFPSIRTRSCRILCTMREVQVTFLWSSRTLQPSCTEADTPVPAQYELFGCNIELTMKKGCIVECVISRANQTGSLKLTEPSKVSLHCLQWKFAVCFGWICLIACTPTHTNGKFAVVFSTIE